MIKIPVIRWGKPYESLESEEIVHFLTGAPVCAHQPGQRGTHSTGHAAGGAGAADTPRHPLPGTHRAAQNAAELFENSELPLGDGTQTPQDFVRQQSASTGLPEPMCRANMAKNAFVLRNMDRILDCLTRGLDLDILTRGHGLEERGVVVSYQAQAPVLGAVLPSNSPGVHTLWLPVVPLQLGLVLKPGSQEPWTPYRIFAAFVAAGIPADVFGLYPGGHDAGGAILSTCLRSMIFGGAATVEQYKGNPRVQVHGPGFSKILLGDDVVDEWERHLDLMVESIYANGGRSCINCSGIWASRHTRAIADALAERLGPVDVRPPDDPAAGLAAFTVAGMGRSVWQMIEADLKQDGVLDLTSRHGPRLVERERCAYLRPVIAHCDAPDKEIARKEFMFPFAAVVQCPQDQMLQHIGPTLVCTAITREEKFIRELSDATHVDRLNIGAIPTTRLNWLQPHEGNLLDFLFRSRAYQIEE